MSDDFDFHVRALGQRSDLNRGTRGKIVGEKFRVNFVHSSEIREVRHKDGAFDDIGEREFLVVQNRFHVLQDAFGLRFDVAADHVSILRINRNLPGTKEQIADTHSMVVGANRSGRMSGFDDGFVWHDEKSFLFVCNELDLAETNHGRQFYFSVRVNETVFLDIALRRCNFGRHVNCRRRKSWDAVVKPRLQCEIQIGRGFGHLFDRSVRATPAALEY